MGVCVCLAHEIRIGRWQVGSWREVEGVSSENSWTNVIVLAHALKPLL